MISSDEVERILALKRAAWDALPDIGSDPVANARFRALCDVCEILGVN
jgi:hypothetical protein